MLVSRGREVVEGPRVSGERKVSEREPFVMHGDKLNPKKDEHDEGINLCTCRVRGNKSKATRCGVINADAKRQVR
ncbi:hypothetical protein E2C01_025685 [Portunus trituberculatus]|uniref:Uncharacterized protein n=1 Tax=Portunus trituberculatus TaxID=210409 RepID=A0A5B7EG59_PORTR|nr:hypothetical protein [Portunus trituberculatus]